MASRQVPGASLSHIDKETACDTATGKTLTPHMDALANSGIRFTDFHVGASVCTPSRSALQTGRIGARTGVTSNFGFVTSFSLAKLYCCNVGMQYPGAGMEQLPPHPRHPLPPAHLILRQRPGSKGGLPLTEHTIAEYLRPAGYKSAAVGKWHLGPQGDFAPTSRGYDAYLGKRSTHNKRYLADPV